MGAWDILNLEKGNKYNITHILCFEEKSYGYPLYDYASKQAAFHPTFFAEDVVKWLFDSPFVTAPISITVKAELETRPAAPTRLCS